MHQAELDALLTESSVSQDEALLQYVNTATFHTDKTSRLVVRTGSISDVKLLLQYCTERRLQLYVVSCGKNWGFGSMAPVKNVTILLDLSPMNRILHYDPEFGTVRCEPGVTFRQLGEFLLQQGNRHFLNMIGGDPESSVVGNILERGDGVGPYCERAEYACAPEVLLANGEVLDVGPGNVPGALYADLSKTGTGPGLQELFFQSNFGIVTKITVWLNPVPATFRSFHFSLADHLQLAKALNRLKSLYDRRILNAPITFWNDYKYLVNATQYPWDLQPTPPLLRETIQKVSNEYVAWFGFGGVYIDHPKMAELTVNELFGALKGLIRKKNLLSSFSTAKINRLKKLHPALKIAGLRLDEVFQKWEKNALLGHISSANTRNLFWRKRKKMPDNIDPQEQRCGLHWNAFLLPFNGDLIAREIECIEEIILRHGFEPVVSLILLNNRYVRVYQQLIFDRAQAKEEQQALQCHIAVSEYLLKAGYTHTRLDILTMNETGAKWLKKDNLHQKIKQALDPEGIISPGRYFLG